MDVIKFLCKDLWTLLFRKQIDNLKTNHRVLYAGEGLTKGVYVLTDNSFKWFSRMSTVAGAQDAINKAQPVLPCNPRSNASSYGFHAVLFGVSFPISVWKAQSWQKSHR
jgi:trafficking protein particle complex subunit 6